MIYQLSADPDNKDSFKLSGIGSVIDPTYEH